jgi:uncharacterized membrane protein
VNSYASATYLIPLSVLILIIVALVIYSVYFLCKNTPLRVWLFVVLLIAVPALALILPDLIVGGYRSAMSRYLMPCQLGIHLAVAYLLSTKITSSFARSWEQKLWQVSAMVLFSCAVVSCTVSSQAETWWNMAYGYQVSPVAGIINKATQPLVVSELSGNNLGNLLALSYRLKAPVQFQLLDKPPFPQISKDFNEMFLYGNSGNWIARLEKEQNFKREPIYKDKRDNEIWLWKLVKKS